MILHALDQLYGRLREDPKNRLPPVGYSRQRIGFRIVLQPDGTLFEIQDIREVDGKRRVPRLMEVPGGISPRTSGVKPRFLWDKPEYLLGHVSEGGKPKRIATSFEAFRKRHLQVETDISAPAFTAVCRFLDAWNPARSAELTVLSELAGAFGVFQVMGETGYVHEDPAVRSWWNVRSETGESTTLDRCLVTGEHGPITLTHTSIKGVWGAKSSGAALVSFNDAAYTSYGKAQSANAPVSEAAAFRYVTALNALLADPLRTKHCLRLGDATVLFWTERPTAVEDIFAQFANDGAEAFGQDTQDESLRQKLQLFLESLREGRQVHDDLAAEARTSFYLLALSPNAARLSVRFFLRGTVGQLLENLRRHFRDIAITPRPEVGKRRADLEFPPAWLLLGQTVRKGDEVPAILSAPLLRAILTGAPYPAALYTGLLRRIRADREVNYLRACILKGYLNRNRSMEVSMSISSSRIERLTEEAPTGIVNLQDQADPRRSPCRRSRGRIVRLELRMCEPRRWRRSAPCCRMR